MYRSGDGGGGGDYNRDTIVHYKVHINYTPGTVQLYPRIVIDDSRTLSHIYGYAYVFTLCIYLIRTSTTVPARYPLGVGIYLIRTSTRFTTVPARHPLGVGWLGGLLLSGRLLLLSGRLRKPFQHIPRVYFII
jgi:hypothetical protein